MRIATWNVNSIRARSESVVAWAETAGIDVLAMQETKCHDDAFPLMSFLAAGYDVAHVGQGAYNGVAIASRVGLDEVEISFDGVPTHPVDGQPIREARSISARCNGVRVWSLYVPNGRTPDDPHYTYKLAWLDALRNHITLRLAHDPAADMMLAGDWNVCPTDLDLARPDMMAGDALVLEGSGVIEITAATFDIAFLDLDLPGLDGMALAQQMRQRGLDTPLVALTARTDAEAEPRARAAGFDDFVRKPVTGDMLAAVIASHERGARASGD